MKYLPIVFCLIFAGLVGFRYYQPIFPISDKNLDESNEVAYDSLESNVDSGKAMFVNSVKEEDVSYDTAYAQYLRRTSFKEVLKKGDWMNRIENSIEAQDKLILIYHREIIKRRNLLNKQVSEIAKLNHQ